AASPRSAFGSRASIARLYSASTSRTARFCGLSGTFVPGITAWAHEQSAAIATIPAMPRMPPWSRTHLAGSQMKKRPQRFHGTEAKVAGWIDVGPADLVEGELRGREIGQRLVLLA